MSEAISSPDPRATRSDAADWLELMAIRRAPHAYQSSEYVSALGGEEADPDGDHLLDDEDSQILESEFDTLLEAVTDEIGWRSDILGDLYPFELRISRRSWSIARRPRDPNLDSSIRVARDVYVACLLMSSARNGRLPGVDEEIKAVKPVAETFQALVYLVAPALLGGPSYWIAFPRPQHDGYAEALTRYIDQIGVGSVTEKKPPSQTSNKDGGVDIISWRAFADGRSNVLLSYGQVASGADWQDKSVKTKLDSHFLKWLAMRPSTHYIPAMYIPHQMHERVRRSMKNDFDEVAQDNAHSLESVLGVVLDRNRITGLAEDILRSRNSYQADWQEHLYAVARWLRSILAEIRQF